MGIFGRNFNSKKKIELLLKEVELWKREYKREMLINSEWSHTILEASLLGLIDYKTQSAIYELQNDKINSIRKKLV